MLRFPVTIPAATTWTTTYVPEQSIPPPTQRVQPINPRRTNPVRERTTARMSLREKKQSKHKTWEFYIPITQYSNKGKSIRHIVAQIEESESG